MVRNSFFAVLVISVLITTLACPQTTLADSLNVTEIGSIWDQATEHVDNVFLWGFEVALIAKGHDGLKFVTFPAPGMFIETGAFDGGGTLNATKVVFYSGEHGRYALVGDSTGRLHVVEISEEMELQEVGVTNRLAHIGDLAIMDHYAIVATLYDLTVVDLVDPANPRLVASSRLGLADDGLVQGVAVRGNTAFVSTNDFFGILNLEDPENPILRSSLAGVRGSNMAVYGNSTVLLTSITGHLRIVDVSDLDHPRLVSDLPVRGRLWDVAVSGDRVLLACDDQGLRVIDISDPANPAEVGYYDTPGLAKGVAVTGPFALVADHYSLRAYDFSATMSVGKDNSLHPQETLLLPAYPNPFNSATTIRFQISVPGQVDLSLYDLYGRQAIQLFHGQADNGFYNISLEAKDLPTGSYFIRLESSQTAVAQKVLLVR